MTKLKIFVSAYACEPGLGSEIGVGWHWVLEMSKYFDLWVLTRQSNRRTIEPWIAEHPEYAGIRFIYYDLPSWARFWKKGLRGVRLYYNLWQACTNRIVKRTMRENKVEIFHHLTYGNFLWPVSRYGQKKFFVWGPGSAGSIVPKEFSQRYTLKSRVKESLQRLMRWTLRYNAGFRSRCSNSDLILCKTVDTLACIPSREVSKAILFTDVAVAVNGSVAASARTSGERLKFLSVGTLDGWRGFDVLIEAFSQALKTSPEMELEIAGKGMERDSLQLLIDKLDAGDRIRLLGKITMEAYHEKMAQADVVVNSCLREGAVTTAFDALSSGKPLLCIETGGYTRYFNDDYAVIIPLGTRAETVRDMAAGILTLTDPAVRKSKGEKAQLAAGQYTWERKGQQIYETLSRAYSQWTGRTI